MRLARRISPERLQSDPCLSRHKASSRAFPIQHSWRKSIFFDNAWLDGLARGALFAVLALGWMNLLIRINGLRSLSKMTNFDFVTTVAFGSLLAGAAQASDWTAFLQAFAAMAGLVVAQALTSKLRRQSEKVEDLIGNQPCLLMRDGEFHKAALEANRITQADLIAKLREANVLRLSEVRAAVLETTGDVSVLHGDATVDELLLKDVRSE